MRSSTSSISLASYPNSGSNYYEIPERCSISGEWEEAIVRNLRLYHDIFCEGFKPLSIWLYYGNGNITRLPGFDVPYGAGFAFMCASDDFALGAVSEIG